MSIRKHELQKGVVSNYVNAAEQMLDALRI